MISNEPPLQFRTSHPMLFANCSMTCLASAVLGELVLPLLCINRILTADFELVIFTVWTLNYLNPAAHRAFCYLICLTPSALAADFEQVIALAHLFSAYAPPHWELNCSSSAGYGALVLCCLVKTRCNSCCFEPVIASGHLFSHAFCKFRACFQWALTNIKY